MEFVGDKIDCGHFRVADFSSDTVFPSIKPTDHCQSLDRSRSGDKPDYRLIVAQRFPSPVGGDEREEAVLDLVPLARSRREVTHGNGQAYLIRHFL